MKSSRQLQGLSPSSGTILFIVLVFVLAVTTIVLISQLHSFTEMDFVQNELNKLKAYTRCFSGAQFALNRFLSSTRNRFELLDINEEPYSPRLLLDGSKISLKYKELVQMDYIQSLPMTIGEQLTDFEITLRLQDSAGLINFFMIRKDLLTDLLASFGLHTVRSQVLIDSIYDWMDRDDFPRQYGAEKDYYRYPSANIPPNRLILSKDELLLIRGMDGQIFSKIKEVIDFKLQNRRLNPNTMPAGVFRLFKDLSEKGVEDIVKMRELREFESLSALTLRTNYNFSAYPRTFQFFTSENVYVTIFSPMSSTRDYFLRLEIDRGLGTRNEWSDILSGAMRQVPRGEHKGFIGDLPFIRNWAEGTEGYRYE
jgi:type II secretory pathway component PulK